MNIDIVGNWSSKYEMYEEEVQGRAFEVGKGSLTFEGGQIDGVYLVQCGESRLIDTNRQNVIKWLVETGLFSAEKADQFIGNGVIVQEAIYELEILISEIKNGDIDARAFWHELKQIADGELND